MFSNTLKKVVVVASVALAVPVLGATSAYADGGDNHGKALGKDKAAHAVLAAPHHGTSTETDPSGSSSNLDGTFQGKSSSTPDQDGTGMDRGADNNDKTGPGTDGNNGCGNEPRLAAPRDGGRPTDDDNNGWCGSKPKPEPQAPVEVDTVTEVVTEVPQAAPAVTDVPKTVVVTTPAAPVTAPVTAKPVTAAAPAAAPQVVAQGTVTPLVGTPVTQAVQAAGFVGPVAPTQGAVVAAGAVSPTALPFTGAPVGLLLLVAGLAVGAGAALVHAGARRTA